LDPAVEAAVMTAAIAAIEGARPRNLEMALEALLFSTNQPLTEEELASALVCTVDDVKATLAGLEKTLADRASSISLWSRSKNGQPAWILDVKTAFRKDVAVLAPPALRVALVETLALIALNQPVSQRRLVSERGSTVYEHVKELMELGYVQKQRRGINFYLKTTPGFANEFGLPDEPNAIRQALAKAAGFAGTPGAVTSERVWVDGQAPSDVQANAEEAAALKRAEEEAAKAAEEAAAKLAAEEAAKAAEEAAKAEAARVAEEAAKAAEEAAKAEAARVAEEAAKAEAARVAEEAAEKAAEATARVAAAEAAAAKRTESEVRRVRADAARAKEDEEARLLAIAAASAKEEDCVVQGGSLDESELNRKKKKGKKAPPPEPTRDAPAISDVFGSLGSEVAW
jgi:chromosome segregation and condensation protein ScpB